MNTYSCNQDFYYLEESKEYQDKEINYVKKRKG